MLNLQFFNPFIKAAGKVGHYIIIMEKFENTDLEVKIGFVQKLIV